MTRYREFWWFFKANPFLPNFVSGQHEFLYGICMRSHVQLLDSFFRYCHLPFACWLVPNVVLPPRSPLALEPRCAGRSLHLQALRCLSLSWSSDDSLLLIQVIPQFRTNWWPRVHFFGKIQIRILVSNKGFCDSLPISENGLITD